MNVKYINPFLDAVKNVLSQFGATNFKLGELHKKEKMSLNLDLTSIIGLVGDIKGNIAYSMSEDTGKRIISTMMMGMPIDTIDELGRSAIGELTNMIMGNAAGLLEENKIFADITPPSVISGKDMFFIISTVETLEVSMETSLGNLHINIGLEI